MIYINDVGEQNRFYFPLCGESTTIFVLGFVCYKYLIKNILILSKEGIYTLIRQINITI